MIGFRRVPCRRPCGGLSMEALRLFFAVFLSLHSLCFHAADPGLHGSILLIKMPSVPHLWGPSLGLSIRGNWDLEARIASIRGSGRFPGYQVDDRCKLFGLSLTRVFTIQENSALLVGVSADYGKMKRGVTGDPLSWIHTIEANGVFLQLNARYEKKLGSMILLLIGLEPGYGNILDQTSAPTSLYSGRQFEDGFTLRLSLGIGIR